MLDQYLKEHRTKSGHLTPQSVQVSARERQFIEKRETFQSIDEENAGWINRSSSDVQQQ